MSAADWHGVYMRDVHRPFSVLQKPPVNGRQLKQNAEDRVREKFAIGRLRKTVLRVHQVNAMGREQC